MYCRSLKKPSLEILELDNCKSESGFMFLQQKRNHLKLTASLKHKKKYFGLIRVIFPRQEVTLPIIYVSIIKWLTHYMQTRQSLSHNLQQTCLTSQPRDTRDPLSASLMWQTWILHQTLVVMQTTIKLLFLHLKLTSPDLKTFPKLSEMRWKLNKNFDLNKH